MTTLASKSGEPSTRFAATYWTGDNERHAPNSGSRHISDKVYRICQSLVEADLPAGFKPVSSLINTIEEKPSRARGLSEARKRLAGRMAQSASESSLQGLRLRAGLSQAALAKAIESHQPNVAELESGRREPSYSTYEKLVSALRVTRDELSNALNNTAKRK